MAGYSTALAGEMPIRSFHGKDPSQNAAAPEFFRVEAYVLLNSFLLVVLCLLEVLLSNPVLLRENFHDPRCPAIFLVTESS